MSATNYSQCSTRKLQHLNKSWEMSVQKREFVGGVRAEHSEIQGWQDCAGTLAAAAQGQATRRESRRQAAPRTVRLLTGRKED